MKAITRSEFWSLPRDDRDTRICTAEDTGTCSVCTQAIVEGQARHGLVHAHYECANVPTVTSTEISSRLKKAMDLLDKVKEKL